jgi:hypothetical protein
VAGDALNDLGDLVISFVIDRMHLDAWPVHALLVRHLPHIRVDLVDRQTGPRLEISGVLDFDWPLIASGKANILHRLGAVHVVGFVDYLPKVYGFGDPLVGDSVCCLDNCHIRPFS